MKKSKLIITLLALTFSVLTSWADCSMSDPLPCVGIPGPLSPDGTGHYAASYFWAFSPSQNIWVCLGLFDDSGAKARYATVLSANANGKSIWFGYASERSNMISSGYHWQVPDFIKITN